MRKLSLFVAFLGAALGAASLAAASFSPVPRAQESDEPVQDGKWLYTRHCAGCHNENGDGKGPTITQMGLQARDFKQGGFAFGDSPEQLKRTITSGIPGRSPMPSFKGVLDDEQMELVIGHVRTLMPKRENDRPRNTEMIVKDRPVIARGKLPAITEGAKETTRGLLVGTPEGLTFEYDLSDVRLLGVRMGRFADREDWGDRGGAYLKPLGKVLWLGRDTDIKLHLWRDRTPTGEPIGEAEAVLTSTRNVLPRASVEYAIQEKTSRARVAQVSEFVEALTTSVGPGFRREWRLETKDDVFAELLFGFESRQLPAAKGKAVWHLVDRGEQGTDVVWEDHDTTQLPKKFTFQQHTLRVIVLRVPQWKPDMAAQLEKELGL